MAARTQARSSGGKAASGRSGGGRRAMGRSVVAEPVGVLGYGDLATSLILVAPLFLAYQVAVAFSRSINGVDFVTRWILVAVGHDHTRYLLVQLVLAALFVAFIVWARRQRAVARETAVPMMLESAIYALTLGSVIVLLMQELFGLGGADPQISSVAHELALALSDTGEAVVVALGAGVHEELVFRLGLMAGTAALLLRLGVSRRIAVIAALAGSSLVFSLAHHAGVHGEPFHLDVFTYRTLAGVVFGLVFYYRSLAHAVYTHFFYDLYVLALK